MAAPDYVPTNVSHAVRSYSSPPPPAGSWRADRPGEVRGPQPVGERLGVPGPDQGYALTLAPGAVADQIVAPGEHASDVVAGAAAIAMKRSGILGRAPLREDVLAGLTIWGYLDTVADPELVELRTALFSEIHHAAHYPELREVVDTVPSQVLAHSLAEIQDAYLFSWRQNLRLDTDEVVDDGEGAVILDHQAGGEPPPTDVDRVRSPRSAIRDVGQARMSTGVPSGTVAAICVITSLGTRMQPLDTA